MARVYLDTLKGDDSKGALNDPTLPYKSLDSAYQAIRKTNESDRITFVLEKGSQVLKLDKYENCVFTGKEPIVTSTPVTLNQVEIVNPYNIVLPAKLTGSLISGDFSIHSSSPVNISEEVPNSNMSYPHVNVFDLSADFKLDSKVNLKVNRMLTLIKSTRTIETIMPNGEYQGGNLFETTDILSNLVINKSQSVLKVNQGNNSGMFKTTRFNNTFCLGSCKGVVLNEVTLDLNIPDQSGLKVPLFVSDKLELKDSQVTVNFPVVLNSTNNAILKVNSKLINVEIDKQGSRIKTITSDYTMDDTDKDIYHVDFQTNINKVITFTIPNTLDISERELFFKKFANRHNNRFIIKVKSLQGSNDGVLTLDRTRFQVGLYQSEGVFYTKNLN